MHINTSKSGQSHYLRLIAAIIVTFAIVMGIGEMMGWPFLRQPAESLISKQLEREVRLDAPFKLHLLGGIKLDVGGLWISAPPAFQAPHFLEARHVLLELRYSDLLGLGQAEAYRIKRLKVDAMSVHMLRNADGHSTWQFKQDDKSPTRPFPIIENLMVGNGEALVQDVLTQADLKVVFETDEGSQSTSQVSASGKFRGAPLTGHLRTHGFLPVATNTQGSPPLSSQGWVKYGKVRAEFDGLMSDLFGEQNVKGTFSVKGPSLSMLGDLVNVTLPTTAAFDLKGLVEKKDEIWRTQIDYARVSKSELSGDFKYDTRHAPPLLAGNLRGKRLILADLAPAFGTRNPDGSAAKPKGDHTIPDRPLDLPSLNRMDASIKVNLDYVDLGNAFSQPIAPLKSDLTIENGRLSLSNIDARTAQGSISGLMAVDAHQVPGAQASANKSPLPPVADWKIDLNWKNIDLEKWLQVSKDRQENAKRKGDKNTPPAYVTGTLNGKSRLTGHGDSTAKLLGSLDGDVALFIHDGSMSHLVIELLGLDVAQAIGVMLSGDQAVPMQCAVMDLKAKKGIITPKVAMIDTPVTLILIDGDIDMATENLNLRLSAKPKNFSPLTLRSPIRVTGTFNNPQATPEGGPIAAKVAASVALAFLNPLAAILPLLDPGGQPDGKVAAACGKSLAMLDKKS
ncbi:MAG: AsmA family protein [Methylophilaceae bacterium]